MKERIVFEALPSRATSLGEAELSGVFGGCGTYGHSCKNDKDCCEGHACYTIKYSTHQNEFRECQKVSSPWD
jgi:hypothetical protein